MMKRRLKLEEIRKLVLTTWLEIAFSGFIVLMTMERFSWVTLCIACLVMLHAISNYSRYADRIESRITPVVPNVFLPSAFIAVLIALVVGFFCDEVFSNPYSLGCYTCALGYFACAFPESYYA